MQNVMAELIKPMNKLLRIITSSNSKIKKTSLYKLNSLIKNSFFNLNDKLLNKNRFFLKK
jgi:hypothetical protein